QPSASRDVPGASPPCVNCAGVLLEPEGARRRILREPVLREAEKWFGQTAAWHNSDNRKRHYWHCNRRLCCSARGNSAQWMSRDREALEAQLLQMICNRPSR